MNTSNPLSSVKQFHFEQKTGSNPIFDRLSIYRQGCLILNPKRKINIIVYDFCKQYTPLKM